MDAEINSEATLSSNLTLYRRIRNMSQESLAELSGTSIRTIQRIERGDSIGSAYTINALANALQISAADLIPQEPAVFSFQQPGNKDTLKLLNLSALAVVLFPLANIILPAIIFWKNKNNAEVNLTGQKLISFQLLWTLGTLAMMLTIPLLLLSIHAFRGSSIPLFIPVYFICVAINTCCIIRFAVCLNQQTPFLKKLPNLL